MKKTIEDLSDRWLDRLPADLSEQESRVLQSAIDRKPLSHDPRRAYDQARDTPGRVADAIARIGGSWTFILSFLGFLAIWTIGNARLLTRDAFDPYPFIFLNLVLSMLAAIQAPIIMMSQNRQAERDRQDAAHDYEVNLKAEIEIMALHEKLDELRHSQIIAMRETVDQMSERLARLEAMLADAGKAS